MVTDRLVYFAASAASGLIKIGAVSLRVGGALAREPERLSWRMATLARELGQPVSVLATTPGYVVVERWYHRRHADARVRGEWFQRSPALQADIAILANGGLIEDQPEEWPLLRSVYSAGFDGMLLRHYRVRLFNLSIEAMAQVMRTKPVNWRQRENSRSVGAVYAVDVACAAQRLGLDLTVDRIRADAALMRGERGAA